MSPKQIILLFKVLYYIAVGLKTLMPINLLQELIAEGTHKGNN